MTDSDAQYGDGVRQCPLCPPWLYIPVNALPAHLLRWHDV